MVKYPKKDTVKALICQLQSRKESKDMAGHSKWNNIKHKKEATDAKRAKAFSQVSKMIRVAVKEGKSGDPKFNPALRVALEKARAVNMPKDKIQKAIDRGLGKSASGATIQEIVYEAFGPSGEAYMIVALTDNPNRTSAEVKYVLSRSGGSLGSPGSASYLFRRDQAGGFQVVTPLNLDEAAKQKATQLIEALRVLEDVEDVYTSVRDL